MAIPERSTSWTPERKDELLELFMAERMTVGEALELRGILRQMVEDRSQPKNDRLLASMVSRLMDVRESNKGGAENTYLSARPNGHLL